MKIQIIVDGKTVLEQEFDELTLNRDCYPLPNIFCYIPDRENCEYFLMRHSFYWVTKHKYIKEEEVDSCK